MGMQPTPIAHGARPGGCLQLLEFLDLIGYPLFSVGSRLDTAGAEIGRRNGEMTIFCGACYAALLHAAASTCQGILTNQTKNMTTYAGQPHAGLSAVYLCLVTG
jgi:hypothetical protein